MNRLHSLAEEQSPDAAIPRVAEWSGEPVEPSPPDPLIGTILLESYAVQAVIGEGGMGRVYEAHHTRLHNKRYAIKVLRPELSASPQIRARFEREVEAVASLQHPGVLGIHDVGTTRSGLPYMVCEYLKGIELGTYLQRMGKLPNEQVISLGRLIVDALQATHAQGVMHRDLKPGNVFLVGDFERSSPARLEIKILDFGLSRFIDRDDQLTKTGIVMGTPGYMSPEQALGRKSDPRTDIYGVGALLYCAATGRPPFDESTPQRTILAVMNQDPPRPRQLNPAVSEGLEVLIQRAMAKAPEDRYPDMEALGLALAALEQRSQPLARDVQRPSGEHEARIARLRLVSWGASATLLLVSSAASIALGSSALAGGQVRLTTTETVLLVALGATSLPPAFLLARHFKRHTWNNTARVLAWIPLLQAPLVAGLFAYGLATFAVRFGDEVAARFIAQPWFSSSPGVVWPGWSALLPVVGLLTASVSALRLRFGGSPPRLGRFLLGPMLTALLWSASAALLYYGLVWRGQSNVTWEASTPASPAGSAPAGEPLADQDSAQKPLAANPHAAPSPAEPAPLPEPPRAPDDELAAAVAGGSQGLERLSQRYPDDPEVLRALMLAHASRGAELMQAVDVLERLVRVAPELRGDAEVRFILQRAAQFDGPARPRAFEVLSQAMGSAGPDMLYEMLLKQPSLAERASAALAKARLDQLFSPALAIAYDLRFAPSCLSRLRLLDRAEKLGDQRSINALSALVSKPPRCGRRGYPACRVRCEEEAARFSQAIEAIGQRLGAPRGKQP